MWHLVTTVGDFWVIGVREKYLLGVEDRDLGWYSDFNQAVTSVSSQETGCYSWDMQDKELVRINNKDWLVGEPNLWLRREAMFP